MVKEGWKKSAGRLMGVPSIVTTGAPGVMTWPLMRN